MLSKYWLVAIGSAVLLVLATAAGVSAAELDERIRKMEEALANQLQVISAQQEALRLQQTELQKLKAEAEGRAGQPKQPEQQPAPQAQPRPQQPAVQAPRTAQTPTQGATAAPTQGDVPPERPQVDLESLADRGGVLTRPGTLVLEPTIDFVQDTSDRVIISGLSVLPAILIGSIDVRRVERTTVNGSLTARLGLAPRIDVDVKVPYVYRADDTTSREIAVEAVASTIQSITGQGLGDIEFAGHYQINDGTGGWPFLIGNLRVKAPTGRDPFEIDLDENGLEEELPTGSGFWAVEPSLSFVLPSPPVVWFGNVRYLWNIERDIDDDFGTIDPGDAVGVTLGMAFGVNRQTSFSLGWEYTYVFETEQNGDQVDGTALRLGSLLLGLSYRATDDLLLNMSIQGGLTDDAADFRAALRIPFSFNLF